MTMPPTPAQYPTRPSCSSCQRAPSRAWPMRLGRPVELPLFGQVLKIRSIRLSSKLLLLVLLAHACGCRSAGHSNAPRSNPEILLKASPGISQAQLETLTGIPARHQFTALRDDKTLRCVSYYFSSYNQYFYFVFTNDALGKIALAPSYESASRGWKRAKRARWRTREPDERLEVVLNAPALTPDDIVLAGAQKYKPGTDPGLTSAFIIVGVIGAPIIVARMPAEMARKRERRSLAQRFDPFRVRLGMSVAEVEQMFDAPHLTETLEDGSELRYYGSAKFGYYYDVHWLSVAFRKEKATAVFSHDFCNQRKLKKQE